MLLTRQQIAGGVTLIILRPYHATTLANRYCSALRDISGTAPLDGTHRLSLRLACTCILATLACIMHISKLELHLHILTHPDANA